MPILTKTKTDLTFDFFMKNAKMFALGISASVILGGASYLVLKEPSEWMDVATKVQAAKVNKDDVINSVYKQGKELLVIHNDNKDKLEELAKYNFILNLKNADNNYVAKLKTQESNVYNNALTTMQNSEKIFLKLLDVSSSYEKSPKDDKKMLVKENFEVFDSLASGRAISFFNVPLKNLNTKISSDLVDAKKEAAEITSYVNQKLKDKSFNLDNAEKNIKQGIEDDVSDSAKEALSANSHGDLTQKDFEEINKEVKDLTDKTVSVASEKVKEDKEKVKDLVNANSGSGTNTVVVHDHGMSFADYYLLYHWMNMGSTNNYYGSSYAASNVGSSRTVYREPVGASVNNYRQSSAVSAPTKITPPISNPYSLKNPTSDLNKKVSEVVSKTNDSFNKGTLSFKDKIASFKANKVATKANYYASVKAKASTPTVKSSTSTYTSRTSTTSRGFSGGSRGGSMGG